MKADSAKTWNRDTALHFLSRSGFGATPAQVDAAVAAGFEETLARSLRTPKQFPARPELVTAVNYRAELKVARNTKNLKERQKLITEGRQRRNRQNSALLGWWLEEMVRTPHPLLEKMTLFWHGHFATSIEKVRSPYLMWAQNDLLRRNALGDLSTLVKGISRDGAMIHWLDLQVNTSKKPNENFGRELLELFTLGEGHYSEEDIMAAARAFTGYRSNYANEFRLAVRQVDEGEKEFMKTKVVTGEEVIDVVLKQKQCARFIVRKLWTFFAYENPEPDLVDRFADVYFESGFQTIPLLAAIFSSKEFYSDKAMGSQIKSPLQWYAQLNIQLEMPGTFVFALLPGLRQLGQVPFAPPSVKGWDGGKAWISTSTLLGRYNLAKVLLGGELEAMGGKFRRSNVVGPDFAQIAPPSLRKDPMQLVESLSGRLFNVPLPDEAKRVFVEFAVDRFPKIDDDTVRDLLHLMVSTPIYQLT